jgi:hypothetical protein
MDFAATLSLTFEQGPDPSLHDVGATLYDISLLWDWAVLSQLPEHEDYGFGNFWYRFGRPVRPDHRLYVATLKLQSPMKLETKVTIAAAAAAVLSTFANVAMTVPNWSLNRHLLSAQVRETESRARLQAAQEEETVLHVASERRALDREVSRGENMLRGYLRA